MYRFRSRILLAAVLLLTGIAGCDSSDLSNHPTSPQPLLGGLLGAVGGTVDGLLGGGNAGDYKLANDPIIPALLGTVLNLTQVIGLNGGVLDLLGHNVLVPVGAVTNATLFSITALPTGSVEVDLSATRKGFLGRLLNIGAQGFEKPVTVTLSYGRSTNIPDPSKLVVLRLNGPNGQPEPLPTRVDTVRRTVTAELDHFSRYAIAFPNRR